MTTGIPANHPSSPSRIPTVSSVNTALIHPSVRGIGGARVQRPPPPPLPLDSPWSRTNRPTDRPWLRRRGSPRQISYTLTRPLGGGREEGAVEGENKPQLNPAAGDAHSHRRRQHRRLPTRRLTDRLSHGRTAGSRRVRYTWDLGWGGQGHEGLLRTFGTCSDCNTCVADVK